MFVSEQLSIWNLTPGQAARCGAVQIFNVVGTLHNPERVRDLYYRLNDGPETPVLFRRDDNITRLNALGDFNIDTISTASLQEHNRLYLRIVGVDGRTILEEFAFLTRPFQMSSADFTLDLSNATTAEQVGQVVEGPWQLATDAIGRRCLEISPEGAGYDRIILFGRHDWTTGYEIRARIAVSALTGPHNVGLIFKWNPHQQGDGTWLPTQWSTGLGYYCSYGPTPGVRIRFGVDVRRNTAGEKLGDHLLGHAHLSRSRYFCGQLRRRLGSKDPLSELALNTDYFYRLRVDPRQYAFTMWRASPVFGSSETRARREPPPQVIVTEPTDLLPKGSVGIIAFQAGIRVYEFQVRPI